MRHDHEPSRRTIADEAAADAALWSAPDSPESLQFAGDCFTALSAAGAAHLLPLAALCRSRAAEIISSKLENAPSRLEDLTTRTAAAAQAARQTAKRLAAERIPTSSTLSAASHRPEEASGDSSVRAPAAPKGGSSPVALSDEMIARLKALFEAGNQHAAQGRHADAEQAFREVVRAVPSISVAHFNLANACFAQSKFGEAADAYFGCLQNAGITADDWQLSANAWNNLGNLFVQTAAPRQARDAFSAAVACDPELASAWWNLGRLAADDGAAGIARLCFSQAIRLSPARRLEPRLSLARLLLDAGRTEAALAMYDEIVAAAPDAAAALTGRAAASLAAGRVTDAVYDCLKVIQATPDDAEAFSLLARANRARGQLTEAQFCDLKSLELAPRSAGVRSHFLELRQFDPAATLDEFLDLTTHWNEVHGSVDTARAAATAPAGSSNPQHRSEVERSAAIESTTGEEGKVPKRKLRLAYLGPDLDRRRTSDWLAAILPHHDRERFELWGYGLTPAGSATETLIRPLFDRWRSARAWSDSRLEQQVREDEIDILIDVVGHNEGNRLPVVARRPAPVVGRWLGFPGTTGVKDLDFLIADGELITRYDESRFAEPVRRVTGSQFILPTWADGILARGATLERGANLERGTTTGDVVLGGAETSRGEAASPAGGHTLPAAAFLSAVAAARSTEQSLTLACFSPLAHITPPCVKLWARVLAAVPDARLWLSTPEFADGPLKTGFEQLLVGQGISSDRLRLSPDELAADDEPAWQAVDLLLDPVPYGDAWSAAAAIVRGIPVVTMIGERFATRKTASLLK
ncbi:MAG TPA: tetratricopeptide repeat protein, partial [Pirellulaceae bacterium]|nr:tetratricopeptide repeat protein [Pirellulaceae bacterium]